MRIPRISTWIALVPILLGVGLQAPALAKKRGQEQAHSGTLDEGRLEVSYFSSEPLIFREADEIDYLWVRPGFEIAGHTFHFVAWPDPEFLGEDAHDRDAKDRRLASQMNLDMAGLFADVVTREWSGQAETSLEAGDVKVEGRIVDCSTGSTAAKVLVGLGAGSGSTTIDLKMTDAATGELLVALHHRVVSGTSWSTTDSKFGNWAAEVAEEIGKKGLQRLYETGDRIKK